MPKRIWVVGSAVLGAVLAFGGWRASRAESGSPVAAIGDREATGAALDRLEHDETRAPGPSRALLEQAKQFFGENGLDGGTVSEAELVAQWQEATSRSHTIQKADIERRFFSESFDGSLTREVYERLVAGLKGAGVVRDDVEVECRNTLCRVELAVDGNKVGSLASAARFAIASLDFVPDGDAGVRVLAFIDPSAETPFGGASNDAGN